MSSFHTAVIGAGPAGLSAAAELSSHHSCVLLDEGQEATARDRDAPRDLLSGVGGAGLFSDGKHSFFPAASALWQLPELRARERAFERTAALLARFGVDAGPLPPAAAAAPVPTESWQAKEYRSIYVPLDARFQMIDALWRSAFARFCGTRVLDVQRRDDELLLEVEREGRRTAITARNLIIAAGRWSPGFIRPWLETKLGAEYAFSRLEFGVRIETRAASPLFARLPGVDGKLRYVDPRQGIEIRTFCTCRNGEVVLGQAGPLCAYSGRADGPPSGRSNLGLLVRTADAALGREIAAALEQSSPESFALSEWRQKGAARVAHLFGVRGAQLMTAALAHLTEFCPELAHEPARIHAPAIEGVGEYPVVDGALCAAPGIYIAGDASGRFRGIVAAMISGRYVAQKIIAGGA